ncbi:MAG: MarR family transcriptional regulator [Gemmatales bacterium]
MAGRPQTELRKKKPFDVVEEELFLNIMRSAEYLTRPFVCLFKATGLTGSQYNVLRILRGHGEEGIPCHEIAEQMVSYDPDLTRLLDRLEKAGMVKRERSTTDRRVVIARIAPAGLKLVNSLDQPIKDMHKKQLKHLSAAKMRTLIDLLEEIRSTAG